MKSKSSPVTEEQSRRDTIHCLHQEVDCFPVTAQQFAKQLQFFFIYQRTTLCTTNEQKQINKRTFRQYPWPGSSPRRCSGRSVPAEKTKISYRLIFREVKRIKRDGAETRHVMRAFKVAAVLYGPAAKRSRTGITVRSSYTTNTFVYFTIVY